MKADEEENLRNEIIALKEQLEEYKSLVAAIKEGSVDALAVYKNGKPDIFTLESTDYIYRVLVENFGESALNITETGLIVYANSAFENLLETTSSAIIGNKLESFIDPKYKTIFTQLFQSAFSGQSKGELVLSHKGKKVPVYVALSSLYPRFAGIGIIFTDLSEKKKQKNFTDQLEQKIRENASFIKQVLDSSVESISAYDIHLNYTVANKASLETIGLPAEQVIGKNIMEIFPEIGDSTHLHNIRRALRGEEVHERQTPGLRQGNIFFDIYFKPIIMNGETRGVLVMARDITQVILSKKLLEETNMDMERKIVRLNHDNVEFSTLGQIAASNLQQSLQKIPSYAKRIKENLKETSEGEIDQNIDSITGATAEMLNQTKTMLDFFAPVKNNVAQLVNLNIIFEEVKRDLVDVIKTSDAIIDSANLPSLHVNPVQIRLVFSKIVSNAIKLRKTRPYIKITSDVATEGDKQEKVKYWKITLSDNGIGFNSGAYEKPTGVQPRPNRRSRVQEKIDLSVCNRILENHGGFIKVKSEAGVGTDYMLYLPY